MSALHSFFGPLLAAPTARPPETTRTGRPTIEAKVVRPGADEAWRRGLVATAQLGAKAGAIDVELDQGALLAVRLYDRARDPAGLPAALRALDGLCAEARRVRVTLASSALSVVVFERPARRADARRAA